MILPKVSVITTFYNSVSLGDFVHKSMKVLLHQTYQNIEFICVHDGSPDNTLQQLKEYQKQDSRIIIIDKKNEGTAQYAKAAGQEAATGDYIMLFDHDDALSLDAISLGINKFLKNPELEMVGFLVDCIYPNGVRKYFHNLDEPITGDGDYKDKLLSGKEALLKTVGNWDFHFRGLYKRDVFKSTSFRFTEKLVNADEIVERQILNKVSKIGNCKGIYTHYIFDNSSAKSFNLKITDLVKTDLYLRDFFKEINIYEPRKKSFELVAYKNIVTATKCFHHFSKTLNREEYAFYFNRIKNAFQSLNTEVTLQNYSGFAYLYNLFLLQSFRVFFYFYQYKS